MSSLAVQEQVSLAPLCTLGVGGPARFFVEAQDVDAVREAAEWARTRAAPLMFLGGGSNLVIADSGFPGLVVHVSLRGLRAEDGALVAAAGESWDDVVQDAVRRGWAGVECLSGIPGRVGATPMQNVGAYGQDVSETIEEVEALELASGRVVRFGGAECGFAYRHSRFKGEDRGRHAIVSVRYRLRPGGAPAVRYADLQRHFSEHGIASPDLEQTRQAVLSVRRAKSMVLDPKDPDARSVGSFFMNPVVSAAEHARLEPILAQAAGEGGKAPAYPTSDGHVKLSAAWLIERSGIARGYRKGRAAVSRKHTLALVNADDAHAQDIVALAREVRDRVRDRFGVSLVPEPVFVGISLD